MRTRSEWFLQPAASLAGTPPPALAALVDHAAALVARPPALATRPPALAARPVASAPHTESKALYVFVACLEFLFWGGTDHRYCDYVLRFREDWVAFPFRSDVLLLALEFIFVVCFILFNL